MTSLDTLKQFLDHVFHGRMDDAVALTDADVVFVAGPAKGHAQVPLYGQYTGRDGARQLFARFADCFAPGAFNVHGALCDGETAVMYGHLSHTVRATGRPFDSDWALVARVRDGRLLRYQFHEDSAALVAALSNSTRS